MGYWKTYEHLSRRFSSLGRGVAKFPAWFIAVPVFIALLLCTGLQRIKSIYNIEYFVTIENSEINRIRDFIESHFPMDIASEFDVGRYTRVGEFAIMMIKAKDGGSLLTGDVANEVTQLINSIQNITTDSGLYRYEDLCVKAEGKCYMNDVESLYRNFRGTFSFKYPIESVGDYEFKFYGTWMSGVSVNKTGMVTAVKAAKLIYFLNDLDSTKEPYIIQWLLRFEEYIRSMDFKSISVLTYTSKSIKYEYQSWFLKMIPYMMTSSVITVMFTSVTCVLPNWIQGKPWIGVTTVIGSGLASLSGFGLLAYFGVPYLFYNSIIPFLVLGIGMDDTFVFLSAWRRTDSKKSIEERIGETYSESAIAVSLTSLTNILSFIVGAMMTPFPSVRVFCTVTATCLFFDYVYQLTFVGACLAMFGHAEQKNLHCFTMVPVKPLQNSEGPWECMHQILLWTGHYTLDLKKTSFLLTIWSKMGHYLTKTWIKIIVVVTFIIYFSFGVWSACSLHCKLQMKNLVFYNSPMYKYLQDSDDIFRQYLQRIQVVIPNAIDYSSPETNELLQKIFNEFESTDFLCDSSMTESWLRSFHQFLDDPRNVWLSSSYNRTDKEDFITLLRRYFLRHPTARGFQKDIVFNDNYTEILASRFFFQTNYTKDFDTFNAMWQKFKELASSFSIRIFVFHHMAFFTEGFVLQIPLILQSIAIATCAIAVISYLFLCSVKCTFCITLCIISISISILGYMNTWGVNINMMSMTILMFVSGFSVDYSSHIACAYMSATGTSSERLKRSVSDVGFPIFQAATTTLLPVLVFIIPACYAHTIFLKVVVLLSVFSGLHALVFLPVFLSLLEDLSIYLTKIMKRKNRIDNLPSGNQTSS